MNCEKEYSEAEKEAYNNGVLDALYLIGLLLKQKTVVEDLVVGEVSKEVYRRLEEN